MFFARLIMLCLLTGGLGLAQTVLSVRAGLLYHVQGEVLLDGRRPTLTPPDQFPMVGDGKPLDTAIGRAEVVLNSQTILWAGQHSRLYFEDTALESTRIVLEQGSLIIEIRQILDGARIEVLTGDTAVQLLSTGVYRVDLAPRPWLKVYGGETSVTAVSGDPILVKANRQMSLAALAEPDKIDSRADQEQRDGLFWWSAYRSLLLDIENKRREPSNWRNNGRTHTKHRYFDVEFSINGSSAGIEYLNRQSAGIISYFEGPLLVNGERTVRQYYPVAPFLPPDAVLETTRGRAEIFLGPGITLRLDRDSRVRLLDTKVTAPAIALEQGSVMIEVSEDGKDTQLRVEFDGTSTTLLKRGLYRVDGSASTVEVWGGQTVTTRAGDSSITTKSGRLLDLASLANPASFDAAAANDGLFDWSTQRSFALFRVSQKTMTDWSEAPYDFRALHDHYPPQFHRHPLRKGPRF